MQDLQTRRRLASVENFIACTEAMKLRSPEVGAAYIQIAGGCAAFNGPESPMTYVASLGCIGPVSSREIDEIETFFRDHKASHSTFELMGFADPSLRRILAERGYAERTLLQGWSKELKASEPSRLKADIQVRPLLPGEEDLWIEVVARGHNNSREIPQWVLHMLGSLGFVPKATALLALVDGSPAGGAVVFVRHGVAFLRTAGTVPQFRRMGVQSALIEARLGIASHAGCDFAFSATAMNNESARNMERFGFLPAYTVSMMQKAL
jgi:ribosomal protein S18 acetylase RimI-like enzyme